MDVSNFRQRVEYVRMAMNLARSNHIVQATARAIWGQLFQNGFTVVGVQDIEKTFTPFVREAIFSLVAVGYFAFVMEPGPLPLPYLLPPESYIIVAGRDIPHFKGSTYNAFFLKQKDCDKYRNNPPSVFVQNAPLFTGQLTCPSMSIIDMHDAIIEFTRLALLNDSINLRPKAWLTKKGTTIDAGVYGSSFMYGNEFKKSSGFTEADNSRNSKLQYMNELKERNSLRSRLLEEHGPYRSFANACLSRQLDISHDPSIAIELEPGIDIVPMPPAHTRVDLVQLLSSFDYRMCNAMGIPPSYLGLASLTADHRDRDSSGELWIKTIQPTRLLINRALEEIVIRSYTTIHAINYKKTGNKKFLVPVSISIEPSINSTQLLTMQPYLTHEAFALYMSKATGLLPSDFRPLPTKGV